VGFKHIAGSELPVGVRIDKTGHDKFVVKVASRRSIGNCQAAMITDRMNAVIDDQNILRRAHLCHGFRRLTGHADEIDSL